MDAIQILANDYYRIMCDNINKFAKLNSSLPKDEFNKVMINHLNAWKVKLINLSNDEYADPMMKQVADINILHINEMLRLAS